MNKLVVNFTMAGEQLANPDGSLPTSATGCSVVTGPGNTPIGDFPKALDFGTAGKAKLDLPLPSLDTKRFCVRVVVRSDAPITARENLVESTAIPFALYLEPISGSTDYRAVFAVAPLAHGWSAATTEFATKLKVGKWYLLDLIYDTDTLGLAVDGTVVAINAFPKGAIAAGTNPALYIGTWVDGARNHFGGQMAALQLYAGIPAELESQLDERRSLPEWFITYKYQQLKPQIQLGAPTGAVRFDFISRAYLQTYTAGLIMYSESIGAAFEMHGAIFQAYSASASKAELGFLVSDETATTAPGGRKSLFSKGGIYWSSATGAVPVVDQIYLDYSLLGSAAIGLPMAAASDVPGGKQQVFQRARMFHKAGAPKAHEVHGAILTRFLATGGLGAWGYPVSNEVDVKNGATLLGKSHEFENCTFYWRSGVGAFEVHGAIRERYRNLNGPLGILGFPTSDERNIPNAPAPARGNSFERGSILWFGGNNVFVATPFKIFLGRLSTKEEEGFTMGQNDLYFRVTVDDNGHPLSNTRFPSSGDYGGHNVIDINRHLPPTFMPNNLDHAFTVKFDVWESDGGAPFGGGDDHLGTTSRTLSAANAWGLKDNQGIMNTGGFQKVNSLAWSVQPIVNESVLTDSQKWWGVENGKTPVLSYQQYAAAFRDVDSEPEDWDVLDWLEKAFYELVVDTLASGGNCFGMSLEGIYARKHRSLLSMPLDRFTNWSTVVGEFNVKHEYQVGAQAIWWFVGQFLSGNTHDPVDVFNSTRSAFARGDHPVVCISQNWDFSGAPHCVLPVGWDDGSKPWKLKICDPNFTGRTKEILVDPDNNRFSYNGGNTYSGGEWSGGRLHYMPYCVLNDRPRTPIWDAILLLLAGVIIIVGNDTTTETVTDDSGVDLDAFGADAVARLKDGRSITNKLVSFKGFHGSSALASEVFMRTQPPSRFSIVQPHVLDPRLGGNVTIGELIMANALPSELQPLAADPKRLHALAGRDMKSIASDSAVMNTLQPVFANAIRTLAAKGPAGRNVRHQLKGKTAGKLQYVVKLPTNEYRLTTPIAAGEKAQVSLEDLATRSSVLGLKAAAGKLAKIEFSRRLGSGKDRLSVVVDNLAVDQAKSLQINIKPGLGGVDILAGTGTAAAVTLTTTIDGQVNKTRYTMPFSGRVRIRPSTALSGGDLKVGKIDNLFGPIREAVAVKPMP